MKADCTAGNVRRVSGDVNLYIVMTGECKPLHWSHGYAAKNVNLYSVVDCYARELGVHTLAICCF